VSVEQGCSHIVVADCFDLHEKLYNARRRGCSVDEQHLCGACRKCIVAGQERPAGNALIFYCQHAFHEECVPCTTDGLETAMCTICTDSRTKEATFW